MYHHFQIYKLIDKKENEYYSLYCTIAASLNEISYNYSVFAV